MLLNAFDCPPLLQEHAAEKTIVYFLTCACVDFVSGGLLLLLYMAAAELCGWGSAALVCSSALPPPKAFRRSGMPTSTALRHSLVASHTFLPCRFLPAVLPRLSHCKALPVMALHGKMKQAARAATLSAFAEAPSGEQLTPSMCCYGPLAVWFRFSSLPLLPMLAADPLRGIHWPMQACCCARMWLREA